MFLWIVLISTKILKPSLFFHAFISFSSAHLKTVSIFQELTHLSLDLCLAYMICLVS